MKPVWTSNLLSNALNINVPQGIEGNVIHFNSKDIEKGDIFIALQGNNDGHDYASDALNKGAVCVIISKKIEGLDESKVILVEDTYQALCDLAEFKRLTSKAKFVGITGSVGKTSTKEIIFNTASNFGKSFKSRANFNNYLGLRLNLASIPDDIEYGIFEVGMDKAGELTELSKILRPDIAIITNIAPVHLAQFDSIDDIAKAKAEIFSGMNNDGFVILNSDDKYFNYFINHIGSMKFADFGEKEGAAAQLYSYEFDGKLAHIKLKMKNKIYAVNTTLGGMHMAKNIACSFLVSNILGFNPDSVTQSLQNLKPARGRGEQIELNLNGHKCILIHDCYNAGPISVTASLNHLAEIDHSNKIAILSDMRELGALEKEYHRELTPYVIKAGIKKLFTVGPLMNELHNELKESHTVKHFNNSEELQQDIINLIDADSIILMKGSNSTGLLKVADYLIKNGKKK